MKHKKKLAARIYDAIFPTPAKSSRREYAAARSGRLNVGWTSSPTSANQEQSWSLNALIARSREAARDNLHIVNYLRLMRANVIGQSGIQLQSAAREADGKTLNLELNKRVEEAWWEWCHSETCTMSGKLDWKGIQDLAVTQCERDGAFLIQLVAADNDFGFSLRTFDVTWLDLNYNRTLQNGNRVIKSIELDAYDKPVAYWMMPPSSEINFVKNPTRQPVRVPADEIIHGMLIHDDESQIHGVPGTAAAILPAKNAYSYEESVIMASRVAVNNFAVLKNTVADADAGEYLGQENADGVAQNPTIDSSPLSITQLLPGWEMQWSKPEHPTQNHPAFSESLDMKIAVALGVPYFLLMGNWTAVNFSSSRGGLGEFRERCKSYQDFIATKLCRPVFHAWLRSAWLSGKLDLTPEEYLEVQNPTWQPRGFEYVDPSKDVETDVLRLQYRLATPSEIAAERGKDYLTRLEKWESDKKMAAEHGQDIDEVYAPKQLAAGASLDPMPGDAGTDPPKKDKKGEAGGKKM